MNKTEKDTDDQYLFQAVDKVESQQLYYFQIK